MQPLNGFNQLPADIRNMMFTRHFTPRMIGNLIRSHKLAIPEVLWQKFFLEESGGYIPSTVTSWKEAYAKMAVLKRNIRLNNFKQIEPGKPGINWFKDYWISTKGQNLIFHGPDGKEIVRACPQKTIWNNYFKSLSSDHFCTSDAWTFNEIIIKSEEQTSFTIWENLTAKMTVTTPGRYTFIEDHYVRIEDRQDNSEDRDLFITNYKTSAVYPPVTIKERIPILQIKDKVFVAVSSRIGMETWNIETGTKLSSTYFPSSFKWDFFMNPQPLPMTICQEHVINADENLCIRAFPIRDLSNSFTIPLLTHCAIENNRFFGFTQNTQSFVEYDLKTKQTIRTFHLQHNQIITTLSVGGNRIWAATPSGSCHIFDTDTGAQVAITNCPGFPRWGSLIFQPPFVYFLKLDSVEFYLFGSGSHLGTLRLAKPNLRTNLSIQYDFVVDQEYNPKFYNLHQALPTPLLKKVTNFFTPKKKEVKKT